NIPVAQAEERKRKAGLSHAPEYADVYKSLELTLSPLVAEIARTAAAWEAREKQALSAVVLTGGGATLKGLKEFMQSKIQNELRLADPFAKTQAPAFLEAILKEAGPEFCVAVGLALRRLQESS
ncbi:MAG: pilus assembly protein PilM, partial [Patescibacteria group bacterium]